MLYHCFVHTFHFCETQDTLSGLTKVVMQWVYPALTYSPYTHHHAPGYCTKHATVNLTYPLLVWDMLSEENKKCL